MKKNDINKPNIQNLWLTKWRINRPVFWLLDIGSLAIFFLLAIIVLADFPGNISYAVVIILLITYFAVRVILTTLRSNDIPPELTGILWKNGLSIIAGKWALYFAPSNKNTESSFGEMEKTFLGGTRKIRLGLFSKNIIFFIILIVILSIVIFLLKNLMGA